MQKMNIEYCTSCKIRLAERGFVKFSCPSCGKEVGRCVSCRQSSNQYTCINCEFVGP
ncbi:MAG: zinc finger domain-containing protein [Methanosarcinaceae archaeon]|nr:zinc finger domain-containing protein [Methanosarcinaceae archaeon]